MSNYAIINQIVRNLLQKKVPPAAQALELKRVWPMVRSDKHVQQPSLFVNMLKICSNIGLPALSDGELIHNHLAAAALNERVPSISISPKVNVTIWNSLMSMYTRCGAPIKAIQLWHARPPAITPDKFTLTCALSACAAVGGNDGLRVGRDIHTLLKEIPYSSWDGLLFTSLVTMYSKCDSPQEAVLLWKIAHHFTMHSWRGTLKCLLKACADLGSQEGLEIGRQIQQFTSSLPESEVDTALHNSLLNMLVKCGDADGAVAYWDNLFTNNSSILNPQIATTALMACAQIGPESLERGKMIQAHFDSPQAHQNPLYVSALINMHAKCGTLSTSLTVWRNFSQSQHQQHLNPDPHLDVVCAAALSACTMMNVPHDGLELGTEIHKFAQKNGITPLTNLRLCNAFMLMYAKCGASDEAIKLWEQLLANQQLTPNEHSYLAILTACASNGQMAYEMGKSICANLKLHHAAGKQTILNVYGAIVNMYGKCGSWEEAQSIFDWCRSNEKMSLSICNAMLAAYGEHGQGSKARDLFSWMQTKQISPDQITFVNLLTAYAHSSLVDEALQVFESMKPKFNITPTKLHITCIVDALGRSGLLDQAEELANSMKEQDPIVYSTLLSSCRLQRDVERAERVALKAMSSVHTGEEAATPYILLGNTYLATEKYDKARELSKQMSDKGLQRKYGQSTVVIKGKPHTFGPNDRSHPHSNRIHAHIDTMEQQLIQDGYKHNTSWVMQDTPEDRKKHLLCRHSEKLALAYALIQTPPNEIIRIDKNLRICGDCHDAISRLSKIYNRTIILRDPRRFHHFQDGKCSCGGVY